MPATVSIKQCTGTTPDVTTITNLRHNTDDTANPGTTNPLVKPAPAGTNYGFWKTVYLNADTSPSGTINNIRFFSDGTIGWTGVILKGKTVATYVQATGTEGVTGDELTGATNVESYTSASPLSVPGSITNPSTGKISDYVELQAVVSDAAVAGALGAETLTFRLFYQPLWGAIPVV